MKFSTTVHFSAEIKNFERFDNIEFEYVDFDEDMKREVLEQFDQKKFRLVFDLASSDPDGDGYSVHSTSSHFKKAKFQIREPDQGIFHLDGEASILVPLKISGATKNDFQVSIIYGDLWKGTENEVKLEIEPIIIQEFDFITT
jgi:hypothetical protein